MDDALYVRFDIAGLSREERDGLVGEVVAQAERSNLHPSVPVVSFTSAELLRSVTDAQEAVHDDRDLLLGDDDMDAYATAIVGAISRIGDAERGLEAPR